MDGSQLSFGSEVARVRDSGVVGHSGRLRELFDFLAERGPQGEPASQADIAETVFGQPQTEVDDATARVYIHRLRKRLEQFYRGREDGCGELVIPAGAYALRFQQHGPDDAPAHREERARHRWALLALAFVATVAVAFWAGRELSGGTEAPTVNAIWRPFAKSSRPLVIAVGDYYIYGQEARDRPEVERMVRDFSINSKTDLARAQATIRRAMAPARTSD